MEDKTQTLIAGVRSKDEVALELMKFITEMTGYGKGATGAGFAGKTSRNPEEQADALLSFYERCRATVYKQAGDSEK